MGIPWEPEGISSLIIAQGRIECEAGIIGRTGEYEILTQKSAEHL